MLKETWKTQFGNFVSHFKINYINWINYESALKLLKHLLRFSIYKLKKIKSNLLIFFIIGWTDKSWFDIWLYLHRFISDKNILNELENYWDFFVFLSLTIAWFGLV